jgi:demethylmenaquinone methyltransferase / 2-methoxy-6-polyprenyl-1,4-benzoquinol methylase
VIGTTPGESSTGTTPPGTSGEQQSAQWVQRMFASIAPKYDFLNHLLSLNVDRRWRKVLMSRLMPVLKQPTATVLDLCCGTGDVLLDLQEIAAAPVIGIDFCHPMLVTARRKAAARKLEPPLIEADALGLPLADDSLDAISIAFGFRNFANYGAGLQELHRVLKPDGVIAILEFSHPEALIVKSAYGFYSRFLLPNIGALLSGCREAYAYLPDSIRKFPRAPELCSMMEQAGFRDNDFQLLTGGIAALHLGYKS